MSLESHLSYERFEDGAVEVYGNKGTSLYFHSHLKDQEKDFDLIKAGVTRQLIAMAVSLNAYSLMGVFNEDLPFISLEAHQVQAIRDASAYHGHLPVISQRDLAEALGVSRQAISGRVARGTLPYVNHPGGKHIPLDVLSRTEWEKVQDFIFKEQV